MSRVTASSAALVHACGWSFRDDVACPPGATSGAATRGTIFGLLAEQKVNGGLPVKLAEMLASLDEAEGRRLVAMWEHASSWLDVGMRPGWVAERAFAYDLATNVGRELPRLEHRDYSDAKRGEVCGTADLVWIDGDSVVVADWKTTSDGAPEIDATAQLGWLALFAARAWGYDQARIMTLKVTEAGVTPIEGEPLDMFDLALIAEQIVADVSRIPGAEPMSGDHCRARYCKAIAICPETSRALEPALLPVAALVKRYPFTTAIESPDHLQALMQMRSMVDAASDAVKDAIKTYVGDREIVCSDGTTIKATYKTMPRESRAELIDAFRLLGGTQEQLDACVHPRVEPAGIKAMKPKNGRAK